MRAYIKHLRGALNLFILQREVDAWSREEGDLLSIGLALIGHEIDGGLRVPVLVHVGLLLVLC